MSKLVIRNGRVMDPASGLDAVRDIAIEDGRIAAIGEDLALPGAGELDASGLIVAPGFIDMHVHLREPGFESAKPFEGGSRPPAGGGSPPICCIPNPSPVTDTPPFTSYTKERP